jgi:uncharacterized protein with HEPN domain
VLRELEVIGEVVKRVSPRTRWSHGKVPWKGMAGFQAVAIHHYESIDLNVVWDIVQTRLPGLRVQIRAALAGPDGDG